MNDPHLPELAVLAAVFNGIRDAVILLDADARIVKCNPAVQHLSGYEPEAIYGKPASVLIPASLQGGYLQLLLQAAEGKAMPVFRTELNAADGTQIPVELSVSVLHGPAGEITGMVQLMRDISREISSERANSRLLAIIDDSEDAIVSKTLEGIITSWNRSAERIFGYTSAEAIGKSITIIIPEDRIGEERMILTRVRAGEKIADFETIRRAKDGQLIPILLAISPICDPDGTVVGISKIARNISVKKVAEERQSRLAAIVDGSEDAIISKTLDGIITSWNRGAEKIFGYSEREAIGRHISFIVPAERRGEAAVAPAPSAGGPKIDHFFTVRKRKDGTMVTVSLTNSPITDSSNNVIGASEIARDITREQEGNEALRQYAERLRILNSLATSISGTLDVQEILQKVTDASTKLVGAAFGAFFYNVIDQDGQSYMLYTLSGASRAAFDKFGMPRNTQVFHPTFSGEGVVRVDNIREDPRYGKMAPHFGMPHGHLPVTSYLAVPVFSVGGTVIGGLFFGHPEAAKFTPEHEDLVVNMAAQAGVGLENSMLFEQVRDLSRKKDEFIALATHELKTPLTSMSGFLQLVESRVADDPVNLSFVSKSLSQLHKLTTLINDLLDVSRIHAGKMHLQCEMFNLTGLTREIIEPQQMNSRNHEFIFEETGDIFVEADRLRLEQVIANFINNAVKYSPEGGKVQVTITDKGEDICFSVKDQGIGISLHNQQHIFDRFYRAEGLSGKISGLGLGLYISKEIIERHGGTVSVESRQGEGATFTFSLPKSKKDERNKGHS